jgi:hypothetical protein
MLRLLSLCILAAVVADESGITLPSAPDKSPPQPVDTIPATISQIAPEEWYVIESPERIRVLASPSGIVAIEESEGPLKLRGKFAGGSKVETRSYSQKWLYVVTAEQAGRCELLLVPGPLDQQVIRQTLTISGSGPRPPPVPDPAPQPTPVQPPSGLQVMLLVDQSDPVSALAAVNSVPVLQWLDSNTTPTDGRPGWRRWDRSSLSDPDTLATESATWRKLWSDIGSGLASGPQLVIITGAKVTTRPIITQPQLLQDLQNAKDGKL